LTYRLYVIKFSSDYYALLWQGCEMYNVERMEKIMNILRERKSCSVSELAKLLSFSEATIRRDLAVLDKQMKVKKIFGGAVICEQYPSEVPYSVRSDENSRVKASLCAAASKMLSDNITVFLDSSSTVKYLVPYIKKYKGITVVTNNPELPMAFSGSDVCVYSTGGRFMRYSNSYVGEFAQNMIRGINADVLFFSARGVSLDGKVTNSSTEDDVHRLMIQNARKTCLLFDSSKLGRTYLFTVCDIFDIDVVITDKKPELVKEHSNVIIAE